MPRTDPGLGPKSSPEESGARPTPKEEKKFDSTEAILDGFGAHRQDRPRVKPAELTPVPEEVKQRQGQVSTAPGQRQVEKRRRFGYIAVVLLCVAIAVLVGLKVSRTSETGPVATTTNATVPPPPPTATQTQPVQTDFVPPTVPTVDINNLAPMPTMTFAKTGRPPTTAKSAPTETLPPPATTAPATTSSGPDPKNDVKRTM